MATQRDLHLEKHWGLHWVTHWGPQKEKCLEKH